MVDANTNSKKNLTNSNITQIRDFSTNQLPIILQKIYKQVLPKICSKIELLHPPKVH